MQQCFIHIGMHGHNSSSQISWIRNIVSVNPYEKDLCVCQGNSLLKIVLFLKQQIPKINEFGERIQVSSILRSIIPLFYKYSRQS
jgi:hypothetical protein